ncbi:MAG TPA: hypothetical protein VI386_17870 [Candidatus Sulfotelmatobacter sp.]
MFSPESKLHLPTGQMSMPNLPGLNDGNPADKSSPFSGIKRAGQAKRAMNFEKWQGKLGNAPTTAPSDNGAKFQNLGGQAGTQVGSMRTMKFQ